MNAIRQTFLETGALAAGLLESIEVLRAWDSPSALEEFSVRGLAGHLLRATGSVEAYLDREEPEGDPVGAAEYYAAAVDETDIRSPLHQAIRDRGEQAAARGHGALVEEAHALLDRLRPRLESEPAGRKLRVYKDLVLSLDDYLVTRLIELVVHVDDLAVTVGLPPPRVPDAANEAAIRTLVDVARFRHGDLAVVRSLTRRERDAIQALRVL
ncbi:MAG: maleylpyruvate isomerase N-terminal domain-containing protein [Actinomycetota bacterium]|nr:maleylpyruvate isomerase N-terminal domain-containing protein [Actinomycetota bacterium]